jgi:hypothetical protein
VRRPPCSLSGVPDRAFRQIDVHVPLEFTAFEPVQYVHRVLIEGQWHLIRKVSVDFENDAHSPMENE